MDTNNNALLAEELRRKYQRDLNCLVDSDRNLRKRSLVKLQRKLIESSEETEKYGKLVFEIFFVEYLQKPILDLLSDSLEKCRETSCTILTEIVNTTLSNDTLIQLSSKLFPIISSR